MTLNKVNGVSSCNSCIFKITGILSQIYLTSNSGDFKLYSSKVLCKILKLTDHQFSDICREHSKNLIELL